MSPKDAYVAYCQKILSSFESVRDKAQEGFPEITDSLRYLGDDFAERTTSGQPLLAMTFAEQVLKWRELLAAAQTLPDTWEPSFYNVPGFGFPFTHEMAQLLGLLDDQSETD
jgi:hypothetical protein